MNKEKTSGYLALIRIKGMLKLNKKVADTLYRLRLRRKYSCVVIKPTKELEGMFKKIKQFVAFGEIDENTFQDLVEKRGQLIDKKKSFDSKKASQSILSGEEFEENNLKPFFRLHPPRKGINTKMSFPKGALGYHGLKINDLIRRML